MSSLSSKIQIGYKNAFKVLQLCKLDCKENSLKKLEFKKINFSKEFIEISQNDNYKEIYEVARRNNDYDIIILDDGAIFQFSYSTNNKNEITEIRYAYFQAPIDIISYEKFLEHMEFDIRVYGDSFYEEYEQYKSELPMKDFVTPIRYDFSIPEYKYVKHPVSHLHIGHNNEIRIPMSVIITPFEFVLFILRHIYYIEWKGDIENPEFRKYYDQARKHMASVSKEYFIDDDKLDLYFA